MRGLLWSCVLVVVFLVLITAGAAGAAAVNFTKSDNTIGFFEVQGSQKLQLKNSNNGGKNWNDVPGKSIELKDIKGTPTQGVFSADNKYFALGSKDNGNANFYLFEIASSAVKMIASKVNDTDVKGDIAAVAVSEDNKYFALKSGEKNGSSTVEHHYFFGIDNKNVVLLGKSGKGKINDGLFSDDGRYFALISEDLIGSDAGAIGTDASVYFFDMADGKVRPMERRDNSDGASGVRIAGKITKRFFSKNGKRFFVASRDWYGNKIYSNVYFLNLKDGKVSMPGHQEAGDTHGVAGVYIRGEVTDAEFSEDGAYLVFVVKNVGMTRDGQPKDVSKLYLFSPGGTRVDWLGMSAKIFGKVKDGSLEFGKENKEILYALEEMASTKNKWEVSYYLQCPDGKPSEYRIVPWYLSAGATVGAAVDPAKASTAGAPPAPPTGQSGGSWEQEMVFALAEFVGNRAEEELVAWFMHDMLGGLCKAGTRDFFPNVCMFKDNNDVGTLPARSVIVEAFRKDIEIVPAALMCKAAKGREDTAGYRDMGYYLTAALKSIRDGAPAVNVIAGFAENERLKKECEVGGKSSDNPCALYWAGKVMQLHITGELGEYVDGKLTDQSLDDLISNKDLELAKEIKEVVDIFEGDYHNLFNDERVKLMVAVKSKKEAFDSDKTNENKKKELVDSLKEVKKEKLVAEFAKAKEKLEENGSIAKDKKEKLLDEFEEILATNDTMEVLTLYKEDNVKESYRIISNLVRDIDEQVKVIKELRAKKLAKDEKPPAAEEFLAPAFRISQDVLDIIDEVAKLKGIELDSGFHDDFDSASEAIVQISAGKYTEAVININAIFNRHRDTEMAKKAAPVLKYLPAVAELASAKNKDDMKRVLSAVASPVGGWRLKKEGGIILSLGSMVGAQYSKERVDGGEKGTSAGIFAPIGLDVSWSVFSRRGSSMFTLGKADWWMPSGVFFSAIDVGNIVSARLTESETVDNKSNIGFAQVVSPGAYLHWSIPKSPIVWGIGVSQSPKLREVTDAGGIVSDRSATRYMAFIAVDLVLFPLTKICPAYLCN